MPAKITVVLHSASTPRAGATLFVGSGATLHEKRIQYTPSLNHSDVMNTFNVDS